MIFNYYLTNGHFIIKQTNKVVYTNCKKITPTVEITLKLY